LEATQITDHAARALSRLIDQYRDVPETENLLTPILNQIQAFEDAMWAMLLARIIDNAEGVHLETLGKIVGQRRTGNTDDEYRTYIKAKIIVNRSRGKRPDLVAFSRLLAPKPSEASLYRRVLREFYPCSVTLEANYPISNAAVVQQMGQQACAAGVRFSIEFQSNSITNDHGNFIFGATEYDSTTQGFGSTGGDTGGRLGTVIG
jgi:hypothetical protein